MRLAALTEVLRDDAAVKKVYLIGQDYSFGQQVARSARAMIAARRPDIQIVGDELHPIGRVKDFLPYASKIQASGAQAVLTGNWGNDLTLLVRALRDVGADARLYTFSTATRWARRPPSATPAWAACSRWPSGTRTSAARCPTRSTPPSAAAFPSRGTTMCTCACRCWLRRRWRPSSAPAAWTPPRWRGRWKVHVSTARAPAWVSCTAPPCAPEHHELQQPLVVSLMDRAGVPGVKHDVEGSGFGFRTLRRSEAAVVAQPATCRMQRPG